MSLLRLACGADQSVGLHQHASFLNLRPQREADHDEGKAEQHADERNAPVGLSIGLIK